MLSLKDCTLQKTQSILQDKIPFCNFWLIAMQLQVKVLCCITFCGRSPEQKKFKASFPLLNQMASKATMQKRSKTLKLQLIYNLEWWTDDLYIEVHFPIMVDLVFTTTYDFSIILNWIIPNLLVCAVCLEIGHPQKICDDGARMLSLLLYRNIPQTVHWIKVKNISSKPLLSTWYFHVVCIAQSGY